jgi:hypothetical protein
VPLEKAKNRKAQPGESEIDAVLLDIEKREDERLREEARETARAGLKLRLKQYEQALAKLDHPVEDVEEKLTPDDQLEYYKMVEGNSTEVITSATQKLLEYHHLKRYKGVQRFKAAVVLARMFPPPPKIDEKELKEALLRVFTKGIDVGISRGKEMGRDEITTKLYNRLIESEDALIKKLESSGQSSKPADRVSQASYEVLGPAQPQNETKPPIGRHQGYFSSIDLTTKQPTKPNIVDGDDLSKGLKVLLGETSLEAKRGTSIQVVVTIPECSELSRGRVTGLPGLGGKLQWLPKNPSPGVKTNVHGHLTLRVPVSAEPGTYPSTITIADGEGRSGAARFNLIVTT